MNQVRWFDRKFNFDSTQNIFPSIIQRLAGTPVRLRAMSENVAIETLEFKLDNSWSVKENIGHLIDLEPLWQGRLTDILEKKSVMRPADLDNNKTHQANHNTLTIEQLLNQFEEIRTITCEMLAKLTSDEIYMSSIHPRLQKPMRIIDLFLFAAEHDDHHLVSISELIKNSASN